MNRLRRSAGIILLIILSLSVILYCRSIPNERIYESQATVEASPTESPTPTPSPSPTVTPTVDSTSTTAGRFKLTAYCPCSECNGQWSGGITSTGKIAQAGRTIAVDPTVIPYGSEVLINGNTYIAEDCGGAIKGNRIDVFFDSHEEALSFGVQYADISLKEGDY